VTSSIAAVGLVSVANVEKITLETGSGKATLTGGAFTDSLVAGDGNDRLNARSCILGLGQEHAGPDRRPGQFRRHRPVDDRRQFHGRRRPGGAFVL
jgi:hypothetical protein